MSADVQVSNEGTVWSFFPRTKVALEWFDENVQSESWQWFGPSLVVDHRFGESLLNGIVAAGLSVE